MKVKKEEKVFLKDFYKKITKIYKKIGCGKLFCGQKS